MPSIGWPEIIIVLVILLVIFGPKRLPHLGKSIGQSVRGFKSGISGQEEDEKKEELETPPAQLNQAQTNAPAQPVPQPVQPQQQAPAPVATTQETAGSIPAAPEPPAAVPPAAEVPEPGERSATQV
jgi:sec-independent protein translocase protein TatA